MAAVAAHTPAYAASGQPAGCPAVSGAVGGCDWALGFNGDSAIAYTQTGTTSWLYNMAWHGELGKKYLSGSKLTYSFTVVYPSNVTVTPSIQGGQTSSWVAGPVTWQGPATDVAAPAGFATLNSGLTWKQRTVSVTYTSVGNFTVGDVKADGIICEGMQLRFGGVGTTLAAGAQMQVTTGLATGPNPTCPIPGTPSGAAVNGYKMNMLGTNNTTAPYNATVQRNNNGVWCDNGVC